MKQLTLIRHGKSDRGFGITDTERPLNGQGKSDARLMGLVLGEQPVHFDRIFTSSAKRAATTAELICQELDHPPERLTIEPALYTFDNRELYHFIEMLDDQLDSVAIVGHNPGITLLINDLCPSARIDNMPTCGVAHLSLNISEWIEITFGCGVLERLDQPNQCR